MADYLSENWLISRRQVLRGLGASLALPFLDCMRPLGAAEKDDRPGRSVFIYLPNGVNTYDYEMPKAGPDYQLSRILTPLEKPRGAYQGRGRVARTRKQRLAAPQARGEALADRAAVVVESGVRCFFRADVLASPEPP